MATLCIEWFQVTSQCGVKLRTFGKYVYIINGTRVICQNKLCSSAFKSYCIMFAGGKERACQSEMDGLYATDVRLSLIIGIICVGGKNYYAQYNEMRVLI